MLHFLFSSGRCWEVDFITCSLCTDVGRAPLFRPNACTLVQTIWSSKPLPCSLAPSSLVEAGLHQLSEAGMEESSSLGSIQKSLGARSVEQLHLEINWSLFFFPEMNQGEILEICPPAYTKTHRGLATDCLSASSDAWVKAQFFGHQPEKLKQ